MGFLVQFCYASIRPCAEYPLTSHHLNLSRDLPFKNIKDQPMPPEVDSIVSLVRSDGVKSKYSS